MAITPGNIIDEVQRKLRDDSTPVTWTDTNAVEYVNNATFALMTFRPHAFAVNAARVLVAGSKQTLPANTYMLLDLIRNMGSDGSTEGKIITLVPRWQIDMLNQHWHKGTGKQYAEHYSYEPEKDKQTYYVFPPVSTTVYYVEENLAQYPTRVTVANQATNITLDQGYEPFIKEWVYYEAYNKETNVGSHQQAMQHLQNAGMLIGVKVQALREAHVRAKEGA